MGFGRYSQDLQTARGTDLGSVRIGLRRSCVALGIEMEDRLSTYGLLVLRFT